MIERVSLRGPEIGLSDISLALPSRKTKNKEALHIFESICHFSPSVSQFNFLRGFNYNLRDGFQNLRNLRIILFDWDTECQGLP